MSVQTPSADIRKSRQAKLTAPSLRARAEPHNRVTFLEGLPGIVLLAGGFLAVALIAVLDFRTNSRLTFSIFYLTPVVACAWWGGFPRGVLLALAGAVAWQTVDYVENPLTSPAVAGWNGVVRFGTLVLIASLVSRLRVGIVRERLLARTDALTGAANGRTFYEVAAAEAERSHRTGRPLTLAYFDVDNFKQLNDRLGHATGDAALRNVVQTICRHLRDADLLARLGGDEFALLLPETEAEGAVALLTRLQAQLAQEMFDKGWPVTLSVGAVTFLRPADDVDLMIQRVDALMYGAKRKGKARIEHAVVWDLAEPATDPTGVVERRAAARVLCNHKARARLDGQGEGQEEYLSIRDLSIGGIGLWLDKELPPGTVLMIEPLAEGPRNLLARVRHSTPEEGGWRHGCELSTRLTAEELRCWLGGQVERIER